MVDGGRGGLALCAGRAVYTGQDCGVYSHPVQQSVCAATLSGSSSSLVNRTDAACVMDAHADSSQHQRSSHGVFANDSGCANLQSSAFVCHESRQTNAYAAFGMLTPGMQHMEGGSGLPEALQTAYMQIARVLTDNAALDIHGAVAPMERPAVSDAAARRAEILAAQAAFDVNHMTGSSSQGNRTARVHHAPRWDIRPVTNGSSTSENLTYMLILCIVCLVLYAGIRCCTKSSEEEPRRVISNENGTPASGGRRDQMIDEPWMAPPKDDDLPPYSPSVVVVVPVPAQ